MSGIKTILSLETAADPASVAVWREGAMLGAHCAPEEGSNSQGLMPLAEKLLASLHLSFVDVDAVVFGEGPGSFTGLRVAAGLAQGFAFGRDLPLLPINTLAGMAYAASEKSGLYNVLTLLDARMGEVYCARFQNGQLQGVLSVLPPEAIDLPSEAEAPNWVLAGNALSAYPVLRERGKRCVSLPDIMPSASAILALALPRLLAGERIDPALALPVYVRDKVAKTVAERIAEGGVA